MWSWELRCRAPYLSRTLFHTAGLIDSRVPQTGPGTAQSVHHCWMYNLNTLYAWIKRKSSCLHDAYPFRNTKSGSAYHNAIHNLTEQILVEFVCQQRSWAQKMPRNPSCFGCHSEEVSHLIYHLQCRGNWLEKLHYSLIGLAESAKPDQVFWILWESGQSAISNRSGPKLLWDGIQAPSLEEYHRIQQSATLLF